MLRPTISACLICVLGIACSVARAAAPGPEAPETAVSPEVASLLAAQSRWSVSAELETAFGYKDNLLLSSSAEERSALVRAGVEVMLLRMPAGRMDYTLFAQAERTRFFSGQLVDHEAEAWMQGEVGVRFSDTLKASLPVTGYYYDQVFDVSDTEAERVVAELKVAGLMLGPNLRWAFHRSGWLEAQVAGERKRYDDGANDSRIGEGHLRLGWRLGDRVELRASGGRRGRTFDDRVQYSAAGRALADTKLKLAEREGEARLDVDWGASRSWRSKTRVGRSERRDNGSGYFDYDVARVGQEVSWTGEDWLVRLDASAERMEFRVQTVGIGVDPSPRIKDEYAAGLRVERKLSERWTLWLDYTWERSRSNDPIASYSLNEGLLGARWSWEK